VHPLRIRAVVIHHIGGYPLAEVGLEAVHAHVQQCTQPVGVPPPRGRIREIDQTHAGLPAVPLPHAAVRATQQVTLAFALGEQRRRLGYIGVDPQADPQPALAQPRQHAGRVRERTGIPLEVAPVKLIPMLASSGAMMTTVNSSRPGTRYAT
jgi:hypothetical protein